MTVLGFTEQSWDCFQNHYDDYTWEELVQEGLQEYYEDLGYDQTTWDNEVYNRVEDDYWVEMDDDNDFHEDKTALAALCYFKETWDGVVPLFARQMSVGDLYQFDDPCTGEDYDMFVSLQEAHMYNIMVPLSTNTNTNCMDTIIFHDHGGIKESVNFGQEPIWDWASAPDTFHVGRAKWSAISAAWESVEGFAGADGDQAYDPLNNNCYLLTLGFYHAMGITAENNATVVEHFTNHLAYSPIVMEVLGIPSWTPVIATKPFVRPAVVDFMARFYAGEMDTSN